jgi:hypothetical protein
MSLARLWRGQGNVQQARSEGGEGAAGGVGGVSYCLVLLALFNREYFPNQMSTQGRTIWNGLGELRE